MLSIVAVSAGSLTTREHASREVAAIPPHSQTRYQPVVGTQLCMLDERSGRFLFQLWWRKQASVFYEHIVDHLPPDNSPFLTVWALSFLMHCPCSKHNFEGKSKKSTVYWQLLIYTIHNNLSANRCIRSIAGMRDSWLWWKEGRLMLKAEVLTVQYSAMVVTSVDRFKSGIFHSVSKCNVLHIAVREHFF